MPQITANVNALVDEAKQVSVWVFNGAPHGPTTATALRIAQGEPLMTDGPFAECKEHIGGFLIFGNTKTTVYCGPWASMSICARPTIVQVCTRLSMAIRG